MTVQPSVRRAVVISALAVEYRAVRSYLAGCVEDEHERGTVYERGFFDAGQVRWQVLLAEIGSGNPGAAAEAERAISYFDPHAVFFVGVAGGVKDVSIGDVVAATQIYGYESGKDSRSFKLRPNVGQCNYSLIQRARALARGAEWRRRIPRSAKRRRVTAFVGPVAAGEKVVASNRSATGKFLTKEYGDALAVEMEGRGFLDAIHRNAHVHALVIRGISDRLSGKQKSDAAGSQRHAAINAAAFLFALLSRLEQAADAGPEFIEFTRPVGPFTFEILDYHVELRLRDATGRQVAYSKTSKVKVTADRIQTYADDLLSDGRIEGLRTAPGSVTHVIRNDKRFLVLTRFDRPLRQGQVLTRTLACEFVDAYTRREEYWLFTPPQPTISMGVTVRFPVGRPCRSCKGWTCQAGGPWVAAPSQPTLRRFSNGGTVVAWPIEQPAFRSSYKLTWRW